MQDKQLSFSDLKLMMDNYQNMIQLNTILLEQQKQLMELQHQIINRQDQITTKQNKTCDQLNLLINKVLEYTQAIEKINDSIKDTCNIMDTNFRNNFNDVRGRVDSVKDSIGEMKVSDVSYNSKLNKNIYVAWGGTAGIIAALISLLVVTFDRFKILTDVYDLLIKVGKHLGI